MCCPLVFEFSVGIGGFVIGLGQISFFFSLHNHVLINDVGGKFSLPLKVTIKGVFISHTGRRTDGRSNRQTEVKVIL